MRRSGRRIKRLREALERAVEMDEVIMQAEEVLPDPNESGETRVRGEDHA